MSEDRLRLVLVELIGNLYPILGFDRSKELLSMLDVELKEPDADH